MNRLVHPQLPEIAVPEMVQLVLEGRERQIPVEPGDGDAYYKFGQTEFEKRRGYAAFPLRIRSQEAIDQLGAHTLEIFAIHPASYMKPLEMVDPTATIVDSCYMGEGTVLTYGFAAAEVCVAGIGSSTPLARNEVRENFLVTYYGTTARGLGFISLTTPAFYSGMEIPVVPGDPRLSTEFWVTEAGLRQAVEEVIQ